MKTPIVPVSVYPGTANTLSILPGTLGPPPSYYYELQAVTVVPPVIEQIDPDDGSVIVAGQPEQTTVTVLKNGNVDMTVTQWGDWAAGPEIEDENYQLDCISLNLGLTRA